MVPSDSGILSVLNRKDLSSQEKTWRNLKYILLSERSQSEKATCCMIPSMWHSGKWNYGDSKKDYACQELWEKETWRGGA